MATTPVLQPTRTADAPNASLAAVILLDTQVTCAERVGALEHIANRPIVEHVLDDLVLAGVDALILAGPSETLLDVRPFLRPYESGFGQIEYVPAATGTRLSSTLARVAERVGDAACIVGPADGLMSDPLPVPPRRDGQRSDLVLVVGQKAPSEADCEGGDARRARGHSQPRASIGMFGPGALRRIGPLFEDSPVDDLLALSHRLAAVGGIVELRQVPGLRRYTGHGEDLLELNRVVLDRLVTGVPAAVGEANTVDGRVLVDPDALVTDSVLVGPCVIGAGAVIRSAYVGPYTSVGARAHVEGSEVERSIIASEACLLHVGTRIVSSVLGPRARVCRDFGLPRGLRLHVSEGAEIAL